MIYVSIVDQSKFLFFTLILSLQFNKRMIENVFIQYIEKVCVTSRSRSEALSTLMSTLYPHTTRKISREEAEKFYYLYARDVKDVKVDKYYLTNKSNEMYKASGY